MKRVKSVSFEQQLQEKTRWAEDVIRSYLPEEEGENRYLLEAMNYSMLSGGKRLRPLMMALSFACFGQEDQTDLFPFMAAMEMIHTHSLIHDDLPVMDNDEYRRGRKTTHVVFGEGIAVLAGDALLNRAYELCAAAAKKSSHPRRVIDALFVLAEKTGTKGMMGGQSVDVLLDGKPIDRETLSYIYVNKTAALIEASLMTGAILAGAGDDDVRLLEQIGRKIGIAFQIRDDILDVYGDEALLGKPIGSDLRNEKTTYLTYYTKQECDDITAQLTQEAVRLMESVPGEHSFLQELLLRLVHREK